MRHLRLGTFLTAGLLAACSAFYVEATTIRNMTTGEILFADDYEGLGTNVSHTTYLDTTGDYDPVPYVGTWNITGGGLSVPPGTMDEAVESDIQVTDHTGPLSAFQGSNFLRVDRAESNSSAIATMASPMTTASHNGHVLRFETMLATPPADLQASGSGINGGANNTSIGFSLVDGNPAHADTTTSITLPFFDDDGTFDNRVNHAAGGNTVSPTNLTYNVGEWNHVVIEYTIGEDTYNLWLNGSQAEVGGDADLPLASEGLIPTEIVGMRFTAGGRNGSNGTRVAQIYLDATERLVPEPGSLALVGAIGVCCVGYLISSRRQK